MKKSMIKLGMLMLLVVLMACGEDNEIGENNDVLTMGTSADYYPFQFIELVDGEEVIVGFDVDIANYIADALGMELEIVDMDFNTLITALRTERVDMVLAGMTPTEERAEVVDFSNIYQKSNEGLMLATSPLTELDDLNGLTVGVQTGTTQEDIGNGLIEDGMDIDLLVMDQIPGLVQQLLAGRADAVILSHLSANSYADVHEELYMVEIIPEDNSGTAIAFPQGSDLTEQVNTILAQMEENGTMKALFEQWLEGVDLD